MSQGEFRRARETFEHMMFVTKAVEPTVKATYWLAMCLKAIGEYDAAFRRFDEVVTRFPVSPYATMARENALYQERKPSVPVAVPGGTGTVASAVGPVAGGTGTVTRTAAPPPSGGGQGASLMALSDSGIPAGAGATATNAQSGARK
jgi:hypothetical protein